jgi:hypothetical protein
MKKNYKKLINYFSILFGGKMSKHIFKFVIPFFFLMLVVLPQNLFGQLSGSYSIPGSPFATVKSAFDSLNLVGVGSGGVTFNITAGYTESVSDSVFILTATGTVSNPIIFQKNGAGANPIVTRTDAGTKVTSVLGGQGDAVIIIQGSDYVTFDGIDVAASDQGIEYGYFLRKSDGTNGCKNITIKNSVVDLTKGTSAFVIGIYSSNLIAGSPVNSANGVIVTSTDGRNENVTLTGNTVQDVHVAIFSRGYNHTTAPYDFYDQKVMIGMSGAGNTLRNFGGGSATASYGVFANYTNNLNVSYNTINNTANGGTAFTHQGYAINHTTSNASNGTYNNNIINLSSNSTQMMRAIFAGTTGVSTMDANNNVITLSQAGTGEATGIQFQSSQTGSTTNMNNNTISYGTFASTSNSNMFANFSSANTVTMNNNQNSGAVSKTGASGNLIGLMYQGFPTNGNIIITGNTFDSITVAGTAQLTGINASGSNTNTQQIDNNTVTYLTGVNGTMNGITLSTALNSLVYNNSVNNLTTSGTGSVTGLGWGGNNATVYNNNVNTVTSGGTTVVGMSNTSSQATSCYKNSVYNLTSTSTGATASLSGIQVTGGSTYNNVYNNYISDLKVPNTTSVGNALFGINCSASGSSTKIGVYHNTIYLNSTGASAYRSFGIFSNSGHQSDIRNNIVVNTSTGNPVSYGRSSTALGTYSSLSDGNNFFATNIHWNGTTFYTTLDSYKNLVYPRDQATFSESSPFVNSTIAPYDLHINTGVATQTESGGRPVTTPVAITDDFDGNTRNANFPDVGADEFSGVVLDLTAPIISYTPFDNTSSLTDRSLVVSVTDPSGVPAGTDTLGWPRVYWKKNYNGTYAAVIPTSIASGNYTFNFGSGVAPGDTVFYYLVAQDGVTPTPNVRAFPTIGAGGYTFNPPAAGTPPTTPSSYRVTSSSLNGDYTVGAAMFRTVTGRTIAFEKSGNSWIPMENGQRYYGDLFVKKVEHPEYDYPDGTDGVYLTLTAAVNDLSLRGVSGPVNFLLTDATYTAGSGETFPYVVNITNEFKPTSTNKVTIKPNTGVTSLIQGTSPVIFRIFSNYINIDGSNSGGTDRSLTIENLRTTFPRVISFASIGTTPVTGSSIKNTIIINGANDISNTTPAITIADSTLNPGGPGTTSGYFTNIVVQNNRIQKTGIGINAQGVPGSGNGNGLMIDNNSLNDTTTNSIGWIGITVTGVDGATVTNNNIGNMITGNTPGPNGIQIAPGTINSTVSGNIIGPMTITSFSAPAGITINTQNANSNLIVSDNTITGFNYNQPAVCMAIDVSGQSGGILINKNKIYNIKNTYISATTAYGSYAIRLFSSLTAANITLANNFIWDITAYGRASLDFHNGYGIFITGSGGGYNIYHNTIALTTDQTLATGLPACINIASTTLAPASLDIRNNIFANFQTVGTERYAIISKAPATVFSFLDNNDYYTTGPNLGYFGTASVLDLAAWKTATGKDVNSISANPQLVSASDLHVNTNFDIVDGKGFYLSIVPEDIDGDTRNNPPDIGADEYTFTPPADPTSVSATATSDSQIDVAFIPNVDSNNVVIVWNLTGLFSTPSGTPPAVDSAFAGGTVLYNGTTSPVSHTGLAPTTVYYYKLFSYNGSYYSTGVTVSDTTLNVENPTGVFAIASSENQINVSFTPNSSNDSVIVVFNNWGTFNTPSGPPPAIGSPFAGGTLLANSTSSPYNHTGLDPNTTYYYKLFSYNGTNYSSGVEDTATTLVPPPGDSYAYHGGFASYGTINLTTGAFTTWNFRPQGNSHYPITADNDSLNSQYAIMSDFALTNYYLMHVNFATISGDSIAPLGALASGQNIIKGMAYNSNNSIWYVVSGNDLGSAAYLYTLNITTGALIVVNQIQNANFPVGIAIDCDGSAYIINIVPGSPSNTAVLNSLNLTTAVATPIGTNLGLQFVTGFSQDMDFDPSNGNLYWSGYWQQGFSGGGSFRLVDVTTGTSTEISTFGIYQTITGFNVNDFCTGASTFQLSVNVNDGWNMVSTPGLNSPDQNVNTWWPDRDMGANVFKYLGGYQSVTTTTPGIGYWMKNAGANTYNTGDEWPAGGIQIVAHDPLTGATGWNLIGGYELSVTAANVTTVPASQQSGPIYKYANGYQVATTVDPGYGYWIKLLSNAQIIIPETMAKGEKPVEYFPENWGRIVITDAAGVSYTLYAVNGEVDLSQYELPPAPQVGMYDFRFSTGRIAEDINSAVQTIEMSGVVYPLTVRVEGMDMKLMDESGKLLNINLKKGEDVVISDATISKLKVSGEMVPTVYSLVQNYPNPFNPSTVIEFTLPEDVSDVQLSVYNALGEKVAELVNSGLTAGRYSYTWNAQNVATGMYIYELRTEKFVSVKKMLLIK